MVSPESQLASVSTTTNQSLIIVFAYPEGFNLTLGTGTSVGSLVGGWSSGPTEAMATKLADEMCWLLLWFARRKMLKGRRVCGREAMVWR